MAKKPARPVVAFVLPHLEGGGSERQTIDQLRHLPRERVEPCLILASRRGRLIDEVPIDVAVMDLGGIRHETVLLGAWRLSRLLELRRPDVVVARLWFGVMLTHLAAWMTPSWSGHIIAVEGSLPLDMREFVRFGRAKVRLLRRAYRRASVVLAISPQVAQQLRHLGVPESQIRVLPNGVDLSRVRELANEPCELIHERPFVVQVGSLRPYKGQDRVIRLLPELEASLRLVLVGEGPERNRLQRLARELGVEARVKFVGFLENPHPFIGSAVALIHAARVREGFGLACAEALALGTPVVHPTGQIRLLPSGSRMEREFPVADDRALAAVVKDAISAPPTDSTRVEARGYMARYDIRSHVQELLAIIAQLRESK